MKLPERRDPTHLLTITVPLDLTGTDELDFDPIPDLDRAGPHAQPGGVQRSDLRRRLRRGPRRPRTARLKARRDGGKPPTASTAVGGSGSRVALRPALLIGQRSIDVVEVDASGDERQRHRELGDNLIVCPAPLNLTVDPPTHSAGGLNHLA